MARFFAAVLAYSTTVGCMQMDPSPAPAPGASVGTLTLDWTIDGTKDSELCDAGVPASVNVIVKGIDGVFAAGVQEPCDSFSTSIELGDGSYAARAVLVGPSGVEIGTRAPIPAFTIFGHRDLGIPIDFPVQEPE